MVYSESSRCRHGNWETEVPIDRNTLLQARQMAVRMEQGPPGLAMWGTPRGNPTGKPGAMSQN